MIRNVPILLGVLFLLGCSQGPYTDGSYEASSQGQYSEVTVEVVVEGGNISDIEILSANETPGMLDPVRETMIPQIIEKQSTEGVDTISGATGSSSAVLEAVTKVLQEARTE